MATDLLLALAWLAVALSLAGIAVPAAARLFPRFPRRGAALAPAVALAVLALVGYWVGHAATGPALAAGLLAVGAVGWLGRHHVPNPRRLVAPAAVFAAAFGLLVAIRYVDPAIKPAGGEQFLDYGLLRATLRADRLPPEDVWFAGRPVRYYYGGQFLGALLIRLTGTAPAAAYNLLQAVVFGTLATAAFGVVEAIHGGDRPAPRAGLLGAFLVALAGPVAPAARALVGALPREIAVTYGGAALVGMKGPRGEALEYARAIVREPGYFYWTARRVVPDVPHVVPFWAFLNGDFRPHMVGAPLLVLVVGLCLAYFRTPARRRRRRRLLVLCWLPAIAGLLGVVNLWDLPTALGIGWLALVLADAHPATLLPGGERIADWDAPAVPRAVAATAVVAVAGALAAVVAVPLLLSAPASDGVGLLPPRSPLGPLLLVYGALLGMMVLPLWLGWRHQLAAAGFDRRRVAAGSVVAGGVLAVLATGGFGAVAVAGPLLLAAWIGRRRNRVGFVAVLVVAGAGLLLGSEFAYARVWPHDPTVPRWNTVYKVGFQIWIVWGLAAAAALSDALDRVGRPTPRRGLLVVGAVLVVLAAVFPAFSLASHFTDVEATHGTAEPTLDGTAYLEGDRPDAAAAIDWLAAREGTPTLLSTPGRNPYTWLNAPASLTGLPTVVGWHHEAGYRSPEQYDRRAADADTVYAGNATTARRILAAYDVDYVYVGPNERAAYGDPAFPALPEVAVAFERGTVTVYELNATDRGGPR